MTISNKIYLGFFSILGLLAAVAYVGISGSTAAGDNFGEYRSLALQTNNSGRVQANMLSTRLYVKNYVIEANDQSIEGVRTRAEATLNYNDELLQTVDTPEKQAIVNGVRADVETYITTFGQVTDLQDRRNDLVNNQLDVLGPQMEQKLTEVMSSAKDDGDAESGYFAGLTLRKVLLARLYVSKFLLENNQTAYDRVMTEFTSFDESVQVLLTSLENPVRRQLTMDTIALAQTYKSAFQEVYQTIGQRNTLIEGTLDQIGPKVANDIETLKLDVKEQQDKVGPWLVARLASDQNTKWIISIGAMLFGLVLAFLLGRSISKPIVDMTGAMRSLADGNLETDIPAQGRKDETGDMAQAVQVFKDNALEVKRLEEESRKAAERAEKARKEAMLSLADTFERSVSSVVSEVSASSNQMQASAENMASNANDTSERSVSVSSTSQQMSMNVQTVATATEELSASIAEISRQISHSTGVSQSAVEEAQTARDNMGKLETSAVSIGEVLELIRDIANQTNLLALNATIEANRAGDAGKGFAVVANEVKSLAHQTARATEEIGSLISDVQATTSTSVQSVDRISDVISSINEITTAVASAVEEQEASTREIAVNVQQAAQGTQDVSDSITQVHDAANETGDAATEILSGAQGLTNQASKLQTEVDRFLSEVRAA